jgi:predicted AlkP superfamily phosphohydrolase/phosphomutase
VWLGDPSDDRLRTNVTELLLSLRDPEGEPVVRTVSSQAEAASVGMGAPDLLCEMVDGSVELHDGLHAATPWVSREDVAWGTHRTEGVVAIRGPGATDRVNGEAPDITPTILALLGLEVPTLEGRSLVSPSTPLTGIEARTPAETGQPSSVYSDEQEAAVLEHLRSLGYVE